MNLVYGSFCPLHEGNARCPCRTLTTNASIWTAAELGDVDRVKAVVMVKGRRPDSLDPHGYTPLHLAAQNGRLSVVRYLLEAGASPDGVPIKASGCGATPLHRAAFAGQLSCVRALLSAGARPSAADSSFLDMRTPLHKAASQGYRDVCLALLEAGSDPNTPDAAGNTALDVLDLSTPAFTTGQGAALASARNKEPGGGGDSSGGGGRGSGGGGSGAGTDACSIVVLSGSSGGGGEKDWDGVREALESYGGRRRAAKATSAVTRREASDGVSDGAGHSEGGGGGNGEACPRAESSGEGPVGVAAGHKSGPPKASAPRTAVGEREGGAAGGPALGGRGRAGEIGGSDEGVGSRVWMSKSGGLMKAGGSSQERKGGGAVAVSAPASSSIGQQQRKQSVDTPGSGWQRGSSSSSGSGSISAGMPCSECLLPSVVMVRAACCGGLLCKTCAREARAPRRKCRRCIAIAPPAAGTTLTDPI